MPITVTWLRVACIVNLLWGFPHSLFAAAWPQKPGELLYVNNFYAYDTTEFQDINSLPSATPRYRKFDLNPYVEYGLNAWVTLGGSLSLLHLRQAQFTGPTRANTGIGDVELFLRTPIYRQQGFVASLQPLIKLPSLTSSSDFPEIGSDQLDAELRGLFGYGFEAWKQDHFANLEVAYRHRFGTPHDQIRIDATLGLRPTERWLILPQVFTTLSTDLPASAPAVISREQDYDLIKYQLSAVYDVSDSLALQFGGFTDGYARNTGQGDGLLFSVWYRVQP